MSRAGWDYVRGLVPGGTWVRRSDGYIVRRSGGRGSVVRWLTRPKDAMGYDLDEHGHEFAFRSSASAMRFVDERDDGGTK